MAVEHYGPLAFSTPAAYAFSKLLFDCMEVPDRPVKKENPTDYLRPWDNTELSAVDRVPSIIA
jgi:hypothetical protein